MKWNQNLEDCSYGLDLKMGDQGLEWGLGFVTTKLVIMMIGIRVWDFIQNWTLGFELKLGCVIQESKWGMRILFIDDYNQCLGLEFGYWNLAFVIGIRDQGLGLGIGYWDLQIAIGVGLILRLANCTWGHGQGM